MSGFSISWLDLREPADRAARAKPLAHEALAWLASAQPKGVSGISGGIIVDLGSGTGSTLRALTAQGASNLVWRLVDNDGALLDEALRRHGKSCLVEDYQADLNIIAELPLGGAQLVTASALFDLASPALVDALVARLAAQKSAFYAALNYDGTTTWTPGHSLDAAVLAAFNQDQRSDKGLGPALGPTATEYLRSAFTAAGYTVVIAPSPWLLAQADEALTRELIGGIAAAVASTSALDKTELQHWQEFRYSHAATGTCSIGHLDLWAYPAGQ